MQNLEENTRINESVSNQSIALEKLPSNQILELAKVFHISKEASESSQPIIQKIKEKLISICLSENEHYLEYLGMSRFKELSPQLHTVLSESLQSVWEIIIRIRIEENDRKKTQQFMGILPKFETYNQSEAFHLRFLSLYRNSDLCPSSDLSQFNSFQKSLFPQDLQNPSYFREAIKPIIKHEEMQDSYYSIADSSSLPKSMVNGAPLNDNQSYSASSVLLQTKNDCQNNALENPKSNMEYEVPNCLFKHCYCKGKSSYKHFFTCQKCQWNFHIECLKITENKQNNITIEQCPICFAENVNSLIFTIKTPSILSDWQLIDLGKEPRIFFTAYQIEKMMASQAKDNLIILKIIKASTYKNTAKNKEKVWEQKSMELPITSRVLELVGRLEDPYIDLKFQDEKNEGQSNKCIIYWGFYIVKKIGLKEILESCNKNHEQSEINLSYLQNYCKRNQINSEFQLNLLTGDNSIPIRGEQCEHPDCMNLQTFVKDSQQKNSQYPSMKLYCEICKESVSKICIDFDCWDFMQSVTSSENKDQKEKGKRKITYSRSEGFKVATDSQSEGHKMDVEQAE